MSAKRPLNEIEAFRAQELLLQRATEGLSDAEAAELAALGADDDYSFDLAAAAIDIATVPIEQMPAGVADKILVAAGVKPSSIIPPGSPAPHPGATGVPPGSPAPHPGATGIPPGAPAPHPGATGVPTTLAGVMPAQITGNRSLQQPAVQPELRAEPPVIPITRKRSRIAAVLSYGALAAGIAIAIGAWVWASQQPEPQPLVIFRDPPTPTPAEGRAQLLANAGDVKTLAWSATPDPAAKGARGDVVWSASKQEGYMRFVGLEANDPKKTQYQLWIFDKNRDDKFPVDGGVFDVGPNGEVIVKISPKLFVNEPVLFAVTVEVPNGVVVSKRERIVVTAAPPKTG